jgi:HD-like signal output (HDOD) protein/CheY-like chemotaxis protein
MDTQIKRRILFVDDEPPVLNLLQVLMRKADSSWEAAFVDGGAKALQMMAAQPFDVVVSDMRMPVMNGAELLEQVRDRHPRTARIVLSGYVDPPLTVRVLAAAHQYQAKPFTFSILQGVLSRLFALEQYVPDRPLQEVIARTHRLPTPAPLYERFLREFASPLARPETVGGLVSQDVAMTAKMLQLANSAFFAPPRAVMTGKEAVQNLGIAPLRTLASCNQAFWGQQTGELADYPLEAAVKHSVAVGLRASRIMAFERGNSDTIKTAFSAGVLHDIGKILLAVAVPEMQQLAALRAETEHLPPWQTEKEVVGASHAHVGSYLLGLWGVPDPIVDAVAWHHQPRERFSAGVSPTTAVHVANWLDHQAENPDGARPDPRLDQSYLQALNVDDQRLREWIQAATL